MLVDACRSLACELGSVRPSTSLHDVGTCTEICPPSLVMVVNVSDGSEADVGGSVGGGTTSEANDSGSVESDDASDDEDDDDLRVVVGPEANDAAAVLADVVSDPLS